jgi:hypothetical protein
VCLNLKTPKAKLTGYQLSANNFKLDLEHIIACAIEALKDSKNKKMPASQEQKYTGIECDRTTCFDDCFAISVSVVLAIGGGLYFKQPAVL